MSFLFLIQLIVLCNNKLNSTTNNQFPEILQLSLLCCRQCGQLVAHQQDVFSMSAEGLQGTYCNVYGYVYETITIHKAIGLRLQNTPPSIEYSWFPG